ncbi:hypothetical protein QCN36_gp79 [Arthrobacter phage CastorTray]|uniref:HNH endonuclease n=3 Tax=Gordonvirus TaxID=1982152 RepID=A0A9E7SZX1_9CAUD|nr:hypothetical protein QCN36_gp79 [Arthrobacter phage CastorTray]YP_010750524.1 HNH endonuclease [Arthrobacter phage Darby]YP_010750710.1 hypothetical protein QCN41_gp78 [Arthrobacter phage ScienceWizSam]QYC55062.1 hypothetical protein SEA_CASTORTRAY_79 [Arthrobacter phage CastorTray]UTN92077.1 HNH endonuclease [Arthrobacter phage Darby]UUG69320.1 hypothetical protein SEA_SCIENCEWIZSAM_78 [Arthrobacter phage ScienceWizSam]
MRGEWRVIPNYPLYEITRGGRIKQVLDGREVKPAGSNGTGIRYHLESKSGRIVSVTRSMLVSWAFPEEK